MDVGDFISGKFKTAVNTVKLPSGKTLDEICSIDGIPFFWFYKRYLLKHVLPQPINVYKEISSSKGISFFRQMQLAASSFAMRKYLFFRAQKKVQRTPKKKEYTQTPKALFLTYPNHLMRDGQLCRIQGVVDELQKDKILEPFPFFVNQLSSFTHLPQNFANIYQYCDKEVIVKARTLSRKLATEWKQFGPSFTPVPLHGIFPFQGIDLWNYFSPVFSLFMSDEFLFIACMYYEACKKMIEKENVTIAFISGQTGLFERSIAAASKTLGIPCILIPHGFMMGNLPSRDVLDNMYLPVFNRTTASVFLNSGVSKKNIRVTGPATYDCILKYKKNEAKRNTLLLLTQPLIEDNMMNKKDYFSMLAEVLQELINIPDVQIRIKLHQREKTIKKYRALISGFHQKRIVIYQNGGANLLYELLAQSKVVINFNATAGVLEASILDIPSITYPFNKRKSHKYGSFDPSLYVLEKEFLRPSVEKMLSNPKVLQKERRRMVKEYCTFIDGKSSQRVANWAYELVKINELGSLKNRL